MRWLTVSMLIMNKSNEQFLGKIISELTDSSSSNSSGGYRGGDSPNCKKKGGGTDSLASAQIRRVFVLHGYPDPHPFFSGNPGSAPE